MDAETKTEFMEKAAMLVGPNLLMCLEQAVTVCTTKRQKMEFTGDGIFKNKQTLEEDYKERPVALQNLYENAKTLIHPDTKDMIK